MDSHLLRNQECVSNYVEAYMKSQRSPSHSKIPSLRFVRLHNLGVMCPVIAAPLRNLPAHRRTHKWCVRIAVVRVSNSSGALTNCFVISIARDKGTYRYSPPTPLHTPQRRHTRASSSSSDTHTRGLGICRLLGLDTQRTPSHRRSK